MTPRAKLTVNQLTGIRGTAARAAGIILLVSAGCTSIREHLAQRHVSRGEVMLAGDDLDAALLEFQAAAKLAPQLAVAHSRMGAIHRRMGHYAQAIDSFVEALRRNPVSFIDTFNLAQLYHVTRRIKDAIQAYLRAVELQPEDFDAQLNLGTCYQQAGDNEQAIERFQRAIEIDPDSPHAWVNLGVALDARKNYYAAIRAYKEALERDNRQPLLLVNLARTYLHQDRLKMARLSLTQAIRMDPDLAAAHEALGYCLFCLRDFEAAGAAYERALACDWRLPRAHAGLGSVYMLRYLEDKANQDSRDRAIEHWHRSLELEPDQARVRKLLARYSPRRRDPEEVLLGSVAGP